MDHVTIRLTTPLRRYAGGQPEVQVPAGTVAEALQQLDTLYPELRGRVVDADGRLRDFVQVHVGRTPLRALGGLPAALKTGDIVSLSSPFSGG